MGYKKLISPEFRVTVGDYEVTDGIEVECFSSKESHMDWCRVELSPQLQGVLKFKDMDEASVELGYEDDFDSLIDGYVRCGDTDYWKEIMIKDDMMKLDRVTIKASFVDCEPQDVIRYVLAYPVCESEFYDRRNFQNHAIGNCEQLLQEMQYIISIIPVDAQKYIRYVEMIEKEIALLKGWRKSDNKILKKIRENEAAKAQKEGASQKAEKQV